MISNRKLHNARFSAGATALERLLFILSGYAVPALLALLSVLAIISLNSNFTSNQGVPRDLQALPDAIAPMSPAQALAALSTIPTTEHYDTRLSEQPIWFVVRPQGDPNDVPSAIEFPSRHLMDLACWDSQHLVPLGVANRAAARGAIEQVKSGFALTLPQQANPEPVLCRASFVGPARLTAVQWQANYLNVSAQEFHRNSGLLDGGLIVLALFVLITALINRNRTYLLFSAWLFVNLRMGALSAGWDTQWLGYALPPDWMVQIRECTTAIYYMVTLSLFCALFRDDLPRVGHTRLIRIAQQSCVPLLILSVVLPFRMFLPILWLVTGLGTAMMAFFMVRILSLTRSRVAMWYAASMGLTLFVSFYEVLAAAAGFRLLSGAFNFVTAALSSSMLAALAIAQQMRNDHRQRLDAQAELKHTFHAMPIGLFTLDMQGQFLSANPALLSMLGANVMAPGRESWAQHFAPGSWQQLHGLMQEQGDGELEVRRTPAQGADTVRTLLVKATLARGRIEGSLQDVTQQKKATEDLLFMANNDPLTKVYNRRGIEQILEESVLQLANGKPLALAYLDLDRFKLINDLYGHATGDDVLQQVCVRVAAMLTGGQHIGRVGGDEFVIVLPDTPIALASWICRGIVNRIGTTPFNIGDMAFQVRGSVGLIEVSPGMPIRDALATADRACRAAKNGHHENLVVYEKNAPAFREREAELDLVARLSSGTAPEGLFVVMQPIMSLKAPHDSLNFEVLLRMRDHDGTLIPTPRVITAAENSGRISVIDRWVLATTLEWLDTHHEILSTTQFVCMNLSGASLNDERFIQDAFVMLSKNLRAASRLCIEITEGVALHDLDNTRRFIDRVRSYGVKVALDDFGAGYTSFSYLRELPADILKIDGSFIVDMNLHPANIAIVEAIVSLAMNLGMRTIAEWAEDNATVQTLADIGVDYVQGFAVARPQAPQQILAATSSASFIQDEALAGFVRTLGAGGPGSGLDLLKVIRLQDMD